MTRNVHIHIHDSLGSSRNYGHSGQRKEEKPIANRLKQHNDLMQKYIKEGMSKEEASKKAYKELFGTKDADWSARHLGNFRFEVVSPEGKKAQVQAKTSAEAINKVKSGVKDGKPMTEAEILKVHSPAVNEQIKRNLRKKLGRAVTHEDFLKELRSRIHPDVLSGKNR